MSAAPVIATALAPPLQDGDLLAAVDMGSNSFHMVVARYTLGQLRIVDRLRETVRLAEGLDGKGGLNAEVRQRALECLSRFGQRVRDIPPQRVHDEALANYLADNLNAWELQADGGYRKLAPGPGELPHSAQASLLAAITA